MKRFGQFILLVMLCLIVAYLVPIYSAPKSNQEEVVKVEKKEASVAKHKAFPYGKLAATGFAKYIGQNASELTKVYGEPLDIQDNNFGGQWWILGDEVHDYLQIEVTANRIKSIFVLGKDFEIAPFELGMSLTDVAALTTIYSNFDITYNKTEYSLELTEDDMNYRPLVAFDNGAFAILHFNQKNGKLIGVRYLDKEMLLDLKPYQVEGELSKLIEYQPKVEQAHIDKNNQLQLQSLLAILDQSKESKIHYTSTLMDVASTTLQTFLNEKSTIFPNRESKKEWDDRQKVRGVRDLQVLNKAEMTRLLELSSLNSKVVKGYLVAPSSDIPFLVMTLYGTGMIETNIIDGSSKEIGVACAEGVVLFIVSNKVTTESSHPEALLKLKNVNETSETRETSEFSENSSREVQKNPSITTNKEENEEDESLLRSDELTTTTSSAGLTQVQPEDELQNHEKFDERAIQDGNDQLIEEANDSSSEKYPLESSLESETSVRNDE
ncbi:CAP-associated domain-containing protein [Vagococcus intermedius]|uniref:CAP-associated domain-containing protein n=1 Tax=Vagococcus intermedius TaxID=2991418 RepID=A0AAF0CU45_9ENTE|nr:CAP-associated domain-containing protein [Vagococcus intermedius]WEG72896.1 CAP-associated domain-containing protein [Vagococcus intermedius]WEG74983.1 CAP-associated domain-containing protein [Vagococcus intermedius]